MRVGSGEGEGSDRLARLAGALTVVIATLGDSYELQGAVWRLAATVCGPERGAAEHDPAEHASLVDDVIFEAGVWLEVHASSPALVVLLSELEHVRAGVAGPMWGGDDTAQLCRAMATLEIARTLAQPDGLVRTVELLAAHLEYGVPAERTILTRKVVLELTRVRDRAPGDLLTVLLDLYHRQEAS